MNLSFLTDEELLKDTKEFARKEMSCTILLLHHLAEVDRRKLYSDLKYPSLYEYCLKELKLSESSALRKINAARTLAEIPEIEEKLMSGALNISNICVAVKFMRDHNIKETTGKIKILNAIENLSRRECENKLFELLGREKPKVTTITITDQTFSILQRTREMLGGFMTNDQLLTKIAEDEIKKIEKERYKQHFKSAPTPVKVDTTYIPAAIKREKYAEAPFCAICGSITDLEYEHIEMQVMGGTHEPDNIRMLCRNCNQRQRVRNGF